MTRAGSQSFGQLRRPVGRAALAALLVTAIVGQVFTDSSVGPGSQAGSGGGTISGYTIDSVEYVTEGDRLSAVSFEIDGVAQRVWVRVKSDGAWHGCATSSSGNAVSCTDLDERVADADRLSVVASGS